MCSSYRDLSAQSGPLPEIHRFWHRQLASKDRSDFEGMVILPAKFSELTKAWSSLAYSTGSSIRNSSPVSTQSKNTSKGTTINHGAKHKQHDAKHDMICEMWYAMHMRASEGKEWTRHQLGKPSVPLERWDDFGRNLYKDHRKRTHGLQMARKTRMTQFCD